MHNCNEMKTIQINKMIWSVCFLLLFHPSKATDTFKVQPDEGAPSKSSSLSLADFQDLLQTEVTIEVDHIIKNGKTDEDDLFKGRNMLQMENTPELIWKQIVDHGWQLTEFYSRRNLSNKSLIRKDDQDAYPFLVCSRTPLLKSGFQRLPPIMELTGALEKDLILVSNENDETCVILTTSFTSAKYLDSDIANDEYAITPLTDLMKISASTIQLVQTKEWSIPSGTQSFRKALDSEEYNSDWERVLRVTLAKQAIDEDSGSEILMQEGKSILSDIHKMGKEGLKGRRRKLSQSNSTLDNREVISLTDAFSLTSSDILKEKNYHNTRTLSSTRKNVFSEALKLGIESHHSCEAMFQFLSIRPNIEGNAIDYILNPNLDVETMHKFQDAHADSSSSNSNCVISLIIGLSLHPLVLNVEVELPVTPDDYQSQWITQSGNPDERPLFDVGLTGKGQIVSVTDSGLDINHRFFGPSSDDVYSVSQNLMLFEMIHFVCSSFLKHSNVFHL